MTSTLSTTIQFSDELMAMVDELSRKTGFSRSQLFVLAMKSFIERYDSRNIQNVLKEVSSEPLDCLEAEPETIDRQHHRSYHRRLIEGTW